METGSGVAFWPTACPGGLMKNLLEKREIEVRNINVLDTCYLAEQAFWCRIGCGGDLGIVHRFIDGIDALEELSIRTFERDSPELWPSIFRHANSLRSLTFRPHKDCQFIAMTPLKVRQIASELPRLTFLGIDISLGEAEDALGEVEDVLKGIAEPRPLGQPREDSCIDELARIGGLQEVELFIKLGDGESSFCGIHRSTAHGTVSFPDVNYETCFRLAQGIFDRFLKHNNQSTLERVGLRFIRNWYQDRGQYHISQVSFRVLKTEDGFEQERDGGWGDDRDVITMEVWNEIEEADHELRGETN